MIRVPPRSTRTDTLFPYTPHFRSDLHEDASALGVHRVGHLPPGCNLRVVVDARLIDEGRCTRRHHGAFGNQQAAGGTLAVVLGHQRVGHVASVGTGACRSEEHTSELQSLMRISYAVFCLKKK